METKGTWDGTYPDNVTWDFQAVLSPKLYFPSRGEGGAYYLGNMVQDTDCGWFEGVSFKLKQPLCLQCPVQCLAHSKYLLKKKMSEFFRYISLYPSSLNQCQVPNSVILSKGEGPRSAGSMEDRFYLIKVIRKGLTGKVALAPRLREVRGWVMRISGGWCSRQWEQLVPRAWDRTVPGMFEEQWRDWHGWNEVSESLSNVIRSA